MFEKLVMPASKNFQIQEVSADAAYSSKRNLEIVSGLGGTAFIPFKKRTLRKRGGSFVWWKSFKDFRTNPQNFYEHYHLRSNVESCFSMIKRKFGSNLVAKNFVGQKNELLLKLICHNVSCLLHEHYGGNIQACLISQFNRKAELEA